MVSVIYKLGILINVIVDVAVVDVVVVAVTIVVVAAVVAIVVVAGLTREFHGEESVTSQWEDCNYQAHPVEMYPPSS